MPPERTYNEPSLQYSITYKSHALMFLFSDSQLVNGKGTSSHGTPPVALPCHTGSHRPVLINDKQ